MPSIPVAAEDLGSCRPLVMVEEALRARMPVLMIDVKSDLPSGWPRAGSCSATCGARHGAASAALGDVDANKVRKP